LARALREALGSARNGHPPGGRAVKGLRIDPQLNQIPAADDLA
jgi:hypothetical protein